MTDKHDKYCVNTINSDLTEIFVHNNSIKSQKNIEIMWKSPKTSPLSEIASSKNIEFVKGGSKFFEERFRNIVQKYHNIK